MLTYSSDREVIYSPRKIQIGIIYFAVFGASRTASKSQMYDYSYRLSEQKWLSFTFNSCLPIFKFKLVAVLTVLQSEVS